MLKYPGLRSLLTVSVNISVIMIRVYANFLILQVIEWIHAAWHGFQFMMTLQIRPPPHATIDNMWKPFPMGYLQSTILRSGNGDTVGFLVALIKRSFQRLHGASAIFQLFHQRVYCLFGPFFVLVALLPGQQFSTNGGRF